MEKVIFYFYSSLPGSMLGVLLDEARKMIESKQQEVFFVMCEGFFDSCLSNPEGNKGICALCKGQTTKVIRDSLGYDVNILKISDYYNTDLSEDQVKFTTAAEVKKFEYKDIRIGLSVLSSYIHITRNQNPKIDENGRKYFKNQILQSMKLIDAFSNIIDEIKPDLVASFNGRFNEIKPVFEISKKKNVASYLYEFEPLENDKYAKVIFKDIMPHSVKGNRWKFDHCWNDPNLAPGENVRLATEFFENKRNGIAAGDKVYVKGKTTGQLPDNWDYNKRNIVIFNSSEDEYISIGSEWLDLTLFPEQILGMKYIFEQYKEREEFQFYVRIHPNLAGIKYRYHLDLYEFEKNYKNVTVIAPNDPMNSYDLMDHCEKVIVFGSTTGLEAAYAGKPVILLGCGWYYYEGFCYIPKTKEEYSDLVNQKLEPIHNENILKLGLFFYHRKSTYLDEKPYFKYINFNPIKYKLFNRTAIGYHYQKMLGSRRLRAYYIAMMKLLSLKIYTNKYSLPREDE